MKIFKPSMICIIMMLPFLVLGNSTGINSKSELPPPVASITNNTGSTELTCSINSISVTAMGGISYSWDGGSSPTTDANSFTTPGTYTVTVTGSDASTATASITITQDITPPVAEITNNTGTTILSCPSSTMISVTAGPAGAESYEWSGGSFPHLNMNNLFSSGTYTVTVTATNGCTSTSSITITNGIIPEVSASSNSPVHFGGDVHLTASPDGAASYSWTGPNGFTSVAQNPVITSTLLGYYTVTVTLADGCIAYASTYVEMEWIYCTSSTGTTELNCTNPSISATAIDTVTNGTYLWSGGSSPTTAVNTFTVPGTYTVTVSSTNGNTLTTSITITQDITPPTAGIVNNSGTTELNASIPAINVTATGGTSYLWNGGSSLNTATNGFSAPDTYTVTVTSANGCTDTESITISQFLNAPANPVVAEISPTGATLDWDGTKGVATWNIRYKKLAEADFALIEDISNKPYLLTGLESGTTYTWNVRSVRNSVTSDWSLDNTFTTTVGIPDNEVDGLSVYYCDHRIHLVKNENQPIKEVIIYDMQGCEVARYAIDNSTPIGIAVNISAANYIVKVVMDDRFGMYKLHVD